MKKGFSVRTIVAIGIGAALDYNFTYNHNEITDLSGVSADGSPVPNTNICTQYGLLAFMAAVFGPLAGLLIGFIGHWLTDLSAGWGVWWSWVIASGVFGLLTGIAAKKIDLDDGEFGKKELIRFNVAQAIAHIVSWIVVAPVLDILIYAEPVNKVFLQGTVAAAVNIVTTAIIGSLLCFAYAKAKPKKDSLKKEQ